jgi:hypothetical protein
MLPILVNYSTVIALISKMKITTVRKCLNCLSGDVMMKSVQVQVEKCNTAKHFFYCSTVKCSAELTAFRRPTKNSNKNINEVKQIYM